MVVVTVLYPKTENSRFDFDYYAAKHIPLVQALWGGKGLIDAEFLRGTGTLDGSALGYSFIGKLTFSSLEAMQAALEAHGAEIMGDIPNFSNVQPVIQLNEPLVR